MAKSDKKTLETSDKLLAATSTTATTSSVVPMDMDSAVNMATAETTIKMAAVGKDVEMSGSSIHQSDMNEPTGAETIVGSSVDDHAKKLLIEWETILISLMHQYNQAAHEKNLERQQSLESEMKQARQNLDHMRSMLTGGSGVSKPVQQLEKRHGIGLTLTRKDLPKFQLASSMNPPFPEEEKFDSEEHFLRTFEKVVYSAGMDIEQVWDRYLPLCIHYDHDAWVEQKLRKCSNWKEARQCFITKFATKHRIRESTTMVFTMTMRESEGITQYTTRFLKAVSDAGLDPSDKLLAQRFLASLNSTAQLCTRIALLGGNKDDSDLTIEQVAKVARDILGDNEYGYGASAILQNAGFRVAPAHGGIRKKPRHHVAVMGKVNHTPTADMRFKGKFHCRKHGWNRTHRDQECFSKPDGHQVVKTQQVNGLSNTFFGTNNKPNKATGESTPCKYCNKTWAPGHRCQEFLEHKNKKILAIKVNQEKTAQRANENESAKDIENGIRDMMMEDINFD